MSSLKPRNVHVLFVHGVGAHERLSSLLQAYQSLRSNIRSAEPPAKGDDDPIEAWTLREFDAGAPITRLTLVQPGAKSSDTQSVHLYEVNYSALANVVRRNHEIDLTALFVSFDLAVNIARHRLKDPIAPPDGGFLMDHKALAAEVQKLAGVLVAATVPILGIPSLVFKQFTRNLVGVFTRFFEDITTFAFDPNGERLISLHVDRTVRAIMESDSFNRFNMDDGYSPDSLVVAGHSLGSIVTHSYIVRHREANSAWLPHKVLTFGSPIGLVSWLWLFLDFEDMDFKRLTLAPYFTWAPLPVSHVPPTPIQWINVVNHLDPIATAFPVDYVDLAGSPRYNAATLTGGRVHHRFIRAGDSAGAAHTSYFEDRDGFLEILGRLAGLRPGAPEDVRDPDTQPADKSARPRSAHWQEADTDLKRLSCLWWLGGLAALATYLGGIAYQCGTWLPLLLLPVYGWPCATIGTLAFFQRLLYSKPTKRTSMAAIKALPCDRQSRPHCIRQKLRRLPLKNEAAYVNSPRPGWEKRMAMWVASFIPSLIAMALPVFVASQSTGLWKEGWTYFTDHLNWQLPVALAFFTGYLICFAISEFLRHWRTAISLATK